MAKQNFFVLPKTKTQKNKIIIIKFSFIFLGLIHALRDVTVSVPKAIQKGENAILKCNYDMEGDILYSVKWYKGRREFYRYTPKENPAVRTFPVTGIHVIVSVINKFSMFLFFFCSHT